MSTHYGPFDYRTDRNKLGIVESYHFTPRVEALIGGETSTIDGELDYTLHAFPNHHRALVAAMRLAERRKTGQLQKLSVDCYFERALRFRPDDQVVRMLFADYLARTQRPELAAAQLDYTSTVAGENPLTHYNLGLLYFQIGRYDEALVQAHRAAALGVSRTELRDKLKAQGKWAEPIAGGASAPQPTPATSAARTPGA